MVLESERVPEEVVSLVFFFFGTVFGVRLMLVAAGTAAVLCPYRLHTPWFVSASAGIGFRVLIGVFFVVWA
jgi:hypothetical protein